MNQLPVISSPIKPSVNLVGKCKKPAEVRTSPNAHRARQKACSLRARQSGKLHSRFAGHMAFGAAVFVSLMAAATVASYDLPLIFGGF